MRWHAEASERVDALPRSRIQANTWNVEQKRSRSCWVTWSMMRAAALAVGLTVLLGICLLSVSAKKGPLITDKVF